MPKGYPYVILAAFGWLSLGAHPVLPSKPQDDQPSRPHAVGEQSAPVGPATPEPIVVPSPDAGCKRGSDQRRSDLCAQWKAADAGFDAARSAEYQTYIGAIGLVLGAITMGAAIAAALYARRAAVATEETVTIAREAADGAGAALAIAERNAAAAADQVKVAQDTASQQLRPWISIEVEIEAFGLTSSRIDLGVLIRFKNIGQSIAMGLVVKSAIDVHGADFETVKVDETFANWRAAKLRDPVSLQPGDIHESRQYILGSPLLTQWTDKGEALCLLLVQVRYQTPFGKECLNEQSFSLGMPGGDSVLRDRMIIRNREHIRPHQMVVRQFRSGRVT